MALSGDHQAKLMAQDEPKLAAAEALWRTEALVTGRGGAGKSSLLALLLRFADPSAGRITVDGRDLRDLPVDGWRRLIAWVPQDPHLSDATVTDNIRLGSRDATDDAVRRAARLAGADELIRALPDGYATRLGERGTRLSSGQRQRIALARAFLRRERRSCCSTSRRRTRTRR